MPKSLIFSFVILLFLVTETKAQIKNDSIVKIALQDVKKFKLDKAAFNQFKKDKTNIYSDLFKPNKSMVSDSLLLSDSSYVSTFRGAAYNKTFKRRTTGYYFLVGGVVYIAATLAATFVLLFVVLAKASK